MNPPGRPILFVAIIGLLAMMGGIVYYASLDNDDLSMATIELQEVELIDVNSIENRAMLKVTFLVTNPGDVTVTVPVISYKLFADASELDMEHIQQKMLQCQVVLHFILMQKFH